MRGYEHIGRKVGAVVRTAGVAGRIEVVAVAPTGSVVDMAVAVAAHNPVEVVAKKFLGKLDEDPQIGPMVDCTSSMFSSLA